MARENLKKARQSVGKELLLWYRYWHDTAADGGQVGNRFTVLQAD